MPKSTLFNREEILDKLIPLFIGKGYNGTSMQDIVDHTQLNRSSIYNTFGEKMALYEAVIKHFAKKQEHLLEKILSYNTNSKEALKIFFKEIFLGNTSEDTNGCLITNCSLEMASDHEDLRDLVHQNKQEMLQVFEQIVSIGISNGDFEEKTNSKTTSLLLYNNFSGLKVDQSTNENKEDLKLIIDCLFDSL